MRTSKIVRSLNFNLENINKSKEIFTKKKVFYLLLFIFTIGLMYGSILLQNKSENLFSLLDIIQQTSAKNKIDDSFIKIMISSFSSSLIFLFIIFLSGFSSIGQPCPFIILFLKGLSVGSCISYFYLTYSFKGLLYVLIIIIPSTFIVIFTLILSSKESIKLSNLLFNTFLSKNIISIKTLKLYIIKNMILVCFLLVSAFLDGLLAVLFADMFKF